jgi:hypothetical protein
VAAKPERPRGSKTHEATVIVIRADRPDLAALAQAYQILASAPNHE